MSRTIVSSRDILETMLRDDRERTRQQHGPGAWDVADVMAVIDRHKRYDNPSRFKRFIQRIFGA